jgi:hypothetical protein
VPWAPDYATAADLQAFLRVGDASDNADFGEWVTTASRMVDEHTNRQFGQLAAPAGRTYRRPAAYSQRLGLWLVEIDDLQDITGLTIGAVAYASSGATLLPDNAPADGRPYVRLGYADCPTMPLAVVARWGWTTVPTQVKRATLLQASRFQSRRDSPTGIAGSSDINGGSVVRLLARVDPDVAVALRGLPRLVRPS